MIWNVVKASVHPSQERIGGELFPSFESNVRHGQPCHGKNHSFTCTGYFRTHSYEKATAMARGY
jgi:hypothetical protein